MKIAVLIARILLGLMFVVFGLNGFLNFIHGPMPTGTAGQFVGALAGTHYFHVVAFVQLLGGILLLAGQFIPLALVLLGPVIFNILLFHATMQPAGLPPGLLAFLLWLIIFYAVRHAFAGIFARRVESPA
jgi:putative oxidoreductase